MSDIGPTSAHREHDLKTTVLGGTGIAISRVALGCGTFGGIGSPRALIGRGLDEDAAAATLDEAVALGINLFDTASSYAQGASEAILGRWLSAQSAELRAGIHLATKVGTIVEESGSRIDLSPKRIAAQLDDSLGRLGVDHVDFCLSHAPDEQTPIEATLEGFAAQMAAGRISHIGACNVTSAQLQEALAASARLGLPRYEWVQNEYNLTRRDDERDLFAICSEHGLGLTPFSPIAGGLLSGKYRRDQAPATDSRLALRPEGHLPSPAQFDAIDRLSREAARRGVRRRAEGLDWVMALPQITAPIAGPSRTPEHLASIREALALELEPGARDAMAAWFAEG